jgi:hypothetical protein
MVMDHKHPCFADRWDEYRKRQYVGHHMDKAHFNALLTCNENGKALHSIDNLGAGCLDAPNEIPFGSTCLIMTIGGWEREEYNKRSREVMHLSERQIRRSESEMAVLLKGILADAEKN